MVLRPSGGAPTLRQVMRLPSPGLVAALLGLIPGPVQASAPPSAPATAPAPPPFQFIAIGCLPYARLPGSEAAYGRVLSEIDRQAPAFAVHLGDLFGSEEPATDELFLRRKREFDHLAGALVFTPGDNEWTDVHRAANGRFQPLERLDHIRRLFFPDESSLGQSPIPLVTQRRVPAYAKFVENARWTRGGVVFATLHIVGSNNNRQPALPGAVEEWRERDQANAAWLRDTMAEARAQSAPGVVLFCQANPVPGNPGFALFLETLGTEARAFGKPVLLVHADEHRFRLDIGFRTTPGGPPVPNLTRLETFGASDFHGVLVTVDPASSAVFLPGPWLVPGNPPPLLPRPTPGSPAPAAK